MEALISLGFHLNLHRNLSRAQASVSPGTNTAIKATHNRTRSINIWNGKRNRNKVQLIDLESFVIIDVHFSTLRYHTEFCILCFGQSLLVNVIIYIVIYHDMIPYRVLPSLFKWSCLYQILKSFIIIYIICYHAAILYHALFCPSKVPRTKDVEHQSSPHHTLQCYNNIIVMLGFNDRNEDRLKT